MIVAGDLRVSTHTLVSPHYSNGRLSKNNRVPLNPLLLSRHIVQVVKTRAIIVVERHLMLVVEVEILSDA